MLRRLKSFTGTFQDIAGHLYQGACPNACFPVFSVKYDIEDINYFEWLVLYFPTVIP